MKKKDMGKPYIHRCMCYSMNPNVKSSWNKCKYYQQVFIDILACEHLEFPGESEFNITNMALCKRKFKE